MDNGIRSVWNPVSIGICRGFQTSLSKGWTMMCRIDQQFAWDNCETQFCTPYSLEGKSDSCVCGHRRHATGLIMWSIMHGIAQNSRRKIVIAVYIDSLMMISIERSETNKKKEHWKSETNLSRTMNFVMDWANAKSNLSQIFSALFFLFIKTDTHDFT